MQRRAAAAYVVFFLVIAAGSYAVIATAEAPAVTVENPDHELGPNDTLTVDGRTYTVTGIEATKSSGGGHGGGGGIDRSATLEWLNESRAYSETWDANTTLRNATVTREDDLVTVEFPEPSSVNLTFDEEAVNRSSPGEQADAVNVTFDNGTSRVFTPVPNATVVGTSLAANNSTVVVDYYPEEVRTYSVLVPDNSTVRLRERPERNFTSGGQEYVIVDRDGDGVDELIPIEEYEGLHRVEITPDDRLNYRGNETSLSIENETATLSWTSPTNETVDVSDGTNVTLNGRQFFAFFPNNDTLYLTSDYGPYQERVKAAERFHERENGFWGVTILSLVAAVLLAGMAYLPRKEV